MTLCGPMRGRNCQIGHQGPGSRSLHAWSRAARSGLAHMIGGRPTLIPAPSSRSTVKSWQLVRSVQSRLAGHQHAPGRSGWRTASGSTQESRRARTPASSVRVTGNVHTRTSRVSVPPRSCTHQSMASTWTPPPPPDRPRRRASSTPSASPLIQRCSPKCTATHGASATSGSRRGGTSARSSTMPEWNPSAKTTTTPSGCPDGRTGAAQPTNKARHGTSSRCIRERRSSRLAGKTLAPTPPSRHDVIP